MLPLIRIKFLTFTAASTLGAISLFSSFAGGQEMVQNLGPVGPHEGLLASAGSMRLIAFFEPGKGRCAVNAVVWDTIGADPGESAKQFTVSLEPEQIVHIGSARLESLNLQCGKKAASLAIIDIEGLSASGVVTQPQGTTR
jgi:hypothetical protein